MPPRRDQQGHTGVGGPLGSPHPCWGQSLSSSHQARERLLPTGLLVRPPQLHHGQDQTALQWHSPDPRQATLGRQPDHGLCKSVHMHLCQSSNPGLHGERRPTPLSSLFYFETRSSNATALSRQGFNCCPPGPPVTAS